VSLYRDQGVVLRTIRLGEADRIVTLATRDNGKVRAVAKGIRRTTSKFGGRLEPMSHVAVQCWRGRELDIVTQAEVIDAFGRVRADLGRVGKAYTVLEVVDQLSQEGHANAPLYDMVVGALRVLEVGDPPLLVAAFVLKVLAAEGAAPELDVCVACGEDSELVAFDPVEGGALCRSCRRGRPLGPDSLALLRAILRGGLRAALAEPASPVTDDVSALVTESIEAHLDRRLRSLHSAVVR
jgi:DNA repair protein RecO (recombination protein O)